MKFYTEKSFKITNDESSDYFYVGNDGDGLDCVEIRSLGGNGELYTKILMHPVEAVLIAKAILELCGEKKDE